MQQVVHETPGTLALGSSRYQPYHMFCWAHFYLQVVHILYVRLITSKSEHHVCRHAESDSERAALWQRDSGDMPSEK